MLITRAVELFEGSAEAAVHWLTTPKKALDGGSLFNTHGRNQEP